MAGKKAYTVYIAESREEVEKEFPGAWEAAVEQYDQIIATALADGELKVTEYADGRRVLCIEEVYSGMENPMHWHVGSDNGDTSFWLEDY